MIATKKLLMLVIHLALVSLFLAACSSTGTSDAKFPTGKFKVPNDKYEGYIFNEDNTWQYLVLGQIGAEGSYSVKGNLWTENGTEECPFPGTYEWSFDGTNLKFELVGEDACDPRRESTDGKTFVLEK